MKMEDMKILALESLGDMSDLLLRKCLVEKLISESTLDQIINPIEKMDWAEKKKRAEALISILETSKTEEEILQRASQL